MESTMYIRDIIETSGGSWIRSLTKQISEGWHPDHLESFQAFYRARHSSIIDALSGTRLDVRTEGMKVMVLMVIIGGWYMYGGSGGFTYFFYVLAQFVESCWTCWIDLDWL